MCVCFRMKAAQDAASLRVISRVLRKWVLSPFASVPVPRLEGQTYGSP